MHRKDRIRDVLETAPIQGDDHFAWRREDLPGVVSACRWHRTALVGIEVWVIIVVFFSALLLTGCAQSPQRSPYAYVSGWRAEITAPHRIPNRHAEISARQGGPSEYGLYILTYSMGIDISSGRIDADALRKNENQLFSKNSTGHSWLILESPDHRVECGHTLRRYKRVSKYFAGIVRQARQGVRNPAAYVWTPLPDGYRHGKTLSLKPTFVAYFPLTRGVHHDIADYIDTYDFSEFSLVDHECTHFVVGAARRAGIVVAYEIILNVPKRITLNGEEITLWHDEKYNRLPLASPDVLENSLRRLVQNGVGRDVTDGYPYNRGTRSQRERDTLSRAR
jgi:hypothetical protein